MMQSPSITISPPLNSNSALSSKLAKDGVPKPELNANIDRPKQHDFLKSHRYLSALIGISHTFLCSGIVFGWASLVPILRSETVHFSSTTYAEIFTAGAIGNYLSNLPFGFLLDVRGPKTCGIVASSVFGIGLGLCSFATSHYCQVHFGHNDSSIALGIGFFLIGFSGPAIQIPTLHLAKLFKKNEETGSGGDAFYMSAQAAAFDGGTAIFALFAYFARLYDWKASSFFLAYECIPLYTLLTAVWIWPNKILEDENVKPSFHKTISNHSFGGPGSPFLSESSLNRIARRKQNHPKTPPMPPPSPLKDAPLVSVLSHPAFYSLATWVSIHILKLNFVVATINDQLLEQFPFSGHSDISDTNMKTVSTLVNIFGAMLPFGFIIMPFSGFLLQTDPMWAFQVANIFGVGYGAIFLLAPKNTVLLSCIAFPMIATSRQLVYSTVFHQIGTLFGFANFGVLLGILNVIVSVTSILQNPLVLWAEGTNSGYFGPNLILLGLTIPLFGIVLCSVVKLSSEKGYGNDKVNMGDTPSMEYKSSILKRNMSMNSYGSIVDSGFQSLQTRGKIHSFADSGLYV